MQELDPSARISFCRILKDSNIIYSQIWSKYVPIPKVNYECICFNDIKCKQCSLLLKFNEILCKSFAIKLIYHDFDYVFNQERFMKTQYNIQIIKQNVNIINRVLYEIQYQPTKIKLENEVDEYLQMF